MQEHTCFRQLHTTTEDSNSIQKINASFFYIMTVKALWKCLTQISPMIVGLSLLINPKHKNLGQVPKLCSRVNRPAAVRRSAVLLSGIPSRSLLIYSPAVGVAQKHHCKRREQQKQRGNLPQHTVIGTPWITKKNRPFLLVIVCI